MTSLKKCYRCGGWKWLTDFYKHPGMRDGRLNKCAECCRRESTRNRKKRLDYYRAYDRKRYKHRRTE